MSDYTKTTDFASKDSLITGNPSKAVRGAEIDTEFNNIVTAVASKIDDGDAIPAVITTRGDLVAGDSTGTPARLAIGTTGKVLKSDGTDASWATPYYACLAYHGTSQTHNNTGNWVDLSFDTNSYDSGSIHVPASSQTLFNTPSWATKARICVFATIEGNVTGVRRIRLATGAGASLPLGLTTGRSAGSQEASYNTEINLASGIFPITGGATYKFQAFQDSGGNLSISAGLNAFMEFFP